MTKKYLWTMNLIIEYNIDLKGKWLKKGDLIEGPIWESCCVEKAQMREMAANWHVKVWVSSFYLGCWYGLDLIAGNPSDTSNFSNPDIPLYYK